MGRRDLKIQKYMSEIAGDAFFWVYFSKMSWPNHSKYTGGLQHQVLTPSQLENVK